MTTKNNVTIRPVEKRDKGSYLRLFQNEDFGCVGINADLKPSIYTEEKIVTGVIEKSILSTEILILEDNGEFIGYASISRPSEHSYHVGHIAIRKDRQNQGYGTMLMNEIKDYAAHDDCDISLECISSAAPFFKKQGFNNTSRASYYYHRPQLLSTKRKSLFVDFALIKEQREEQNRQEIESMQKFLKSPLFKDIMNMI